MFTHSTPQHCSAAPARQDKWLHLFQPAWLIEYLTHHMDQFTPASGKLHEGRLLHEWHPNACMVCMASSGISGAWSESAAGRFLTVGYGGLQGLTTAANSIYVRVADNCPCVQYDATTGAETGTNPPCCGDVNHFDLSYFAFEKIAHPVRVQHVWGLTVTDPSFMLLPSSFHAPEQRCGACRRPS